VHSGILRNTETEKVNSYRICREGTGGGVGGGWGGGEEV